MANDKAAEQVRATISNCCSAIDAIQVESTKLTATKWNYHSRDRVGEHKPDNAGGKTTSNVAGSSVVHVATPQLNGKVVQMSVVKDQAARTEESGANHNLFNTVELLENILVKLPIRDLLFAQSVCKMWKNCINHSKILQQGLFFTPPELKPVEMIYDAGAGDNLQTALHAKADASDNIDVKFLRTCFTFCANPLIMCAFGPETLATHLLEPSKSPRVEERFTRSEASWKRMSILYPLLELPDVLLPIKRKLESFRTREEAIARTGGPPMMVVWEESLKRLAHSATAFTLDAAQKYETAEQLASAVDELKRREKS